jgi:hypothetical protein
MCRARQHLLSRNESGFSVWSTNNVFKTSAISSKLPFRILSEFSLNQSPLHLQVPAARKPSTRMTSPLRVTFRKPISSTCEKRPQAADGFIKDLFLLACRDVLGFFVDLGEVMTQLTGDSPLPCRLER